MSTFLKHHLARLLVGSLSIMGFSIGALQWLPHDRHPVQVDGEGWKHLSLPIGLVMEPDWLAGWDKIESVAMDVAVEPGADDSLPDDAGTAEARDQQFRIQLHGILEQESGTAYCFFDTEINRWFWLTGGEFDHDSQVRVMNPESGRKLEDTRSGTQYLINSDEYLLCEIN